MAGPILITGASGQLGQRVLHHLLHTYCVPGGDIIAATRTPDALRPLMDLGVTVRRADFDDTASLDTAFAGAERLLLISTDKIDRPGARLLQHQTAVAIAEQCSVGYLVYTSMPDPSNSPLLFAPDHEGTEAAIAASAVPAWTILRNNPFFETVYCSAQSALSTGRWPSAAGNGRIAYIARDDVARAAAHALVNPSMDKATLTLTGAESYSYREVADILSRMIGSPISVQDVSIEGLINSLVASGQSAAIAHIRASIETAVGVGRLSYITDDFRRLTGSEPQRLESWIRQSIDHLALRAA